MKKQRPNKQGHWSLNKYRKKYLRPWIRSTTLQYLDLRLVKDNHQLHKKLHPMNMLELSLYRAACKKSSPDQNITEL